MEGECKPIEGVSVAYAIAAIRIYKVECMVMFGRRYISLTEHDKW